MTTETEIDTIANAIDRAGKNRVVLGWIGRSLTAMSRCQEPEDLAVRCPDADGGILTLVATTREHLLMLRDRLGPARLIEGDLVQYRKVGTFMVIRPDKDIDPTDGAGWYICLAVKAPKKYRDEGEIKLYVGLKNLREIPGT